MNKQTYLSLRRSIRDNGLRYTAQHAIDTEDFDAIFLCDDLANLLKQTDWLSMRALFARSASGSVAFRLTTH